MATLWSDTIQSAASINSCGFNVFANSTEHPIDTTVAPSDSNGANLSLVTDPLTGSGQVIRHYGLFDAGGARAQTHMSSSSNTPYHDAIMGTGVYVAEKLYFPSALSGSGWLNIRDFHSITDVGGDRWDTAPGLLLRSDGSMQFQYDNHGTSQTSGWSSIGLPVGEWFWLETFYKFSSVGFTMSSRINGTEVLSFDGMITENGTTHTVGETYLKWYGETQGAPAWSPAGATKFVRAVNLNDAWMTFVSSNTGVAVRHMHRTQHGQS